MIFPKHLFVLVLLGTICTALPAQAQGIGNLSTDRRALAGSDWRLVSFGPSGAEAGLIAGTSVTLKFGEDGRAGGSTGCNSYSGTYQVRGDMITFGRLISIKRACLDQNANQQEQRYLSALESASRFRLSSKRLMIFYSGGRSVLSFGKDSSSAPDGGEPDDGDPVTALSSYYDGINSRDYALAYRYWESPPSSLEQFARDLADTERVRLLIEPPARVDGAAGSLYAEVPTILIARTRNGGERIFAGCYVMRKSNLQGQERPQRPAAWRIFRANISPVSSNAGLARILSQACR